MHRRTIAIYDERGKQWAAKRTPVRLADASRFAGSVAPGALRADLGCGAGRYISDIGAPVIGIDASRVMLEECRSSAPKALVVQGDLEALPFAAQSLHGGWANMSYLHVPGVRLPMALADLHRSMIVGAPLDIQVLGGDYEGDALAADDVGGRYFCAWSPERLCDVLTGAGFGVERILVEGEVVRATATRLRSLPDFVGKDMRLLVVGLNPSIYAADAGVGFARPNNRFWRAAVGAGVVERMCDPVSALVDHGIGMTDLVKRATRSAAGIGREEYVSGLGRVERLVGWLEPRALCMVGLSGWRAAVDPGAKAGLQGVQIGGRPVYVMPSTSGANAHTNQAVLTEHIRRACEIADLEGASKRTGWRS